MENTQFSSHSQNSFHYNVTKKQNKHVVELIPMCLHIFLYMLLGHNLKVLTIVQIFASKNIMYLQQLYRFTSVMVRK